MARSTFSSGYASTLLSPWPRLRGRGKIETAFYKGAERHIFHLVCTLSPSHLLVYDHNLSERLRLDCSLRRFDFYGEYIRLVGINWRLFRAVKWFKLTGRKLVCLMIRVFSWVVYISLVSTVTLVYYVPGVKKVGLSFDTSVKVL